MLNLLSFLEVHLSSWMKNNAFSNQLNLNLTAFDNLSKTNMLLSMKIKEALA